MKKIFSLSGIIIVLASLFYLESPYSFINDKHMQISSTPYEVLLADSMAQRESETVTSDSNTNQESAGKEEEGIHAQDFVLEKILEDTSEVDGYVVETYREYEIYQDKNGQVINKVPTSNFDYIRYYKNE